MSELIGLGIIVVGVIFVAFTRQHKMPPALNSPHRDAFDSSREY